ncbi:DUF5908 family protein [Mangrovibacterium diazotrophicum]|uniref:Uncharacterized protein n=1 Tax=Mangrovibacterium diazotrophicum TaxID=1261403 RepID=A0A419VYS1_9BACT|nr:DUF5908 family protein [Mangrovibacterium diazotrophicum]RKD88366.1 hypothetical protein BC643_3515 [Mangrovibacterium diazotrophicum]
MPIEIKELIIRAIVDDSASKEQKSPMPEINREKQDRFAEKVDMLMQLIKDKNER